MQEAIIVAKIILRKFPNRFDSIVKDFCEKLVEFYEPDSKAAIIWMVGEYAEKINQAEEIINKFADSFLEEPI